MSAARSEYRELYYRWEKERWLAHAVELDGDAPIWSERLDDDARTSIASALGSLSTIARSSLVGLVPLADRAPTEEQQLLFSTQLADEARHIVFFDRIYAEVMQTPSEDEQRRVPHLRGLLDAFGRASAAVASDGSALAPLVQAIVVYHVVLEGTVGGSTLASVLDACQRSRLAGIAGGLRAVARDESRHLAFATAVLQDAVGVDPRHRDTARAALDDVVPMVSDGDRVAALHSLSTIVDA